MISLSSLRRPSLFLPSLALGIGLSGTFVACSDDEITVPPPPSFGATLNGANERPTPLNVPATGTAVVTKNGTTYTYTINYAGLSGTPTMAHIHGPGSAAVAIGVLVGFPVTGAASGTGTLTGTFTGADIVAARGVSADSLDVLLANGNSYVNVHSSTYPGGEIRGQLVPR